jgi:hypothetical protein
MKTRISILGVLVVMVVPSIVWAQSNAPKYRWTIVDRNNVGGTLSKKISVAPASIKVTGSNVLVWMLTENYRASDQYREKYYAEYSIDCRTGYAKEVTAVMDRFGRGKPPRYGQRKAGFNDYDDVLAVRFGGEAVVLGNVAKKSCPK